MTARWVFALIGALAVLAGAASWIGTRGEASAPAAAIAPGALLAASFTDEEGRPASLARFPGKILVVNFWATWCAPCREEMPAFDRLQAEWGPRGVQFVGLSAEAPEVVRAFSARLPVRYPLWTGDEASILARRLGNSLAVLPFTAVIDAKGAVVAKKVGPYNPDFLASQLEELAAKSR